MAVNVREYEQARRQTWEEILRTALQNLGYEAEEKYDWVIERTHVLSALRRLCAKYGDNDWKDDLDLGDVFDKHLWKLGDHIIEQGVRSRLLLVVDLLNQSRYAFRSKQVQEAREILDAILEEPSGGGHVHVQSKTEKKSGS